MRLLLIGIALLFITTPAIAAKPKEDTGASLGKGALDCSDAIPVQCNGTLVGVGVGSGSVDSYNCTSLSYAGGDEIVYEIELKGTASFTIQMEYTHSATNDLDLFVVSPCNPNACVGSSGDISGIEIITGTLIPAGVYYVVVDAWNGKQDGTPHTLTVTSTDCTVPLRELSFGEVKAVFGN